MSGSDSMWQELSFSIDGRYLVFPVTSDSFDIVLVQQQADYLVFVIAGSCLFTTAVVVGIVLGVRKHRKGKQTTEGDNQGE